MSSTRIVVPAPQSPQFTQYTLPRKFKKESKLHVYLAEKEPQKIQMNKVEYTLYEVLYALRQVISRERLYDPNNITVIICSTDLEKALNVKFLHVTEIRDQVLIQMELLPPALLASLTPPPVPIPMSMTGAVDPKSGTTNGGGSCGQAQAEGGQAPGAKFDMNGQFWVKPNFLKVLRSVQGVNQSQVVFTYREVTSYLSQYILDNKEKFFDSRNVKIAHVENDPLGVAFNVKVFHRSQVTNYLRSQLIPYTVPTNKTFGKPPSSGDTQTYVFHIENETSRKRSLESAKDEPVRRIRRRTSSSSLKKERESDEETIYSAQGYSTTAADNVNEDDHDEASHDSSSDSVNEFDVYEIEYEPEGVSSDDDEVDQKRSKKAGESSSGESDIDEVIIATAVKLLEERTSEDELTSDEASSNDEADFTRGDNENADYWKCLDCKQPNTPYIRYCSACYKERKGWMPERPKPKRKRDTKSKSTKGQSIKSSKQPQLHRSLSETTAASSSSSSKEETSDVARSSQDSGFSEEVDSQPLVSSDEETPSGSLIKSKSLATSAPSMLCTLCCAQPKNACLVHGRISHQVCCYGCAKKLFKNKRGCPVCRRRIEKITKNIIA